MSEINIYPAEIKDDLGEEIANNNSLSFMSKLEIEPRVQGIEISEAEMAALAAHLGERPERDTYDLFPVKTILVSTGWNGNDDVFTGRSVWAARHSPEDKPFNLEHQPRHSIGHITGSAAVDVDLNIIPVQPGFGRSRPLSGER